MSITAALKTERTSGPVSGGSGAGHASAAGAAPDARANSSPDETGATLEQTTKQNARAQLSEGDAASRHLHGIYQGDLPSALVSGLTGADTRRDWAAKAVRAYSNAISLDASLAEAYLGRARVYRFLERYAEAKPDLQRAEDLGITDASGAVKHAERRLRTQRLAVVAAAVAAIVTGASVLWFVHFSHAVQAPTHAEPTQPLASNAPVGHVLASNESRSASVPQPQAIASAAPTRNTTRAPLPSPQTGGVAATGRVGITPRPASQPKTVAPGDAPVNAEVPATDCDGPTPAADCAVRAQPFAIAALATEPSTAAATGHQATEQVCVHCGEMIASLPGASALARDDVEMIRLACRSAEPGGAEAYRACAVSQITRLEDAIRMPDLSAIPALDRQLIQSACVAASHGGPAAYRRCIGAQLIGLASAPELPDLSALTTERKRMTELACRDSAATGAAAYHTCLDRQVKQVRRKPAAPAAPAGG